MCLGRQTACKLVLEGKFKVQRKQRGLSRDMGPFEERQAGPGSLLPAAGKGQRLGEMR